MTRRRIQVGAGVLVAAMGALAVYHVVAGTPAAALRSNTAAHAHATQAATPSAQVTALDPLTIAAMRDRAYPASTLTSVRSDGDQGGYVDTVVSFVSDGLTEYALMGTPGSTRPAAGWPAIIICHGYSDPRTYRTDDSAYAQFIAAFARAGYLVLKPDYRGHGKSQGVPEGGYLSPVYTYDVLNLISTLRADPRVDPTRIGLYGHSLGGYEALRALAVAHGIRAVTFMAGVVGSLDDIFYNWPPPPSPTAPPPPVQQQVARSLIAARGTPHTQPEFWSSVSPINYVAGTTAAVQINIDVGDSQVPKLFSDHLYAALLAAGASVEYITYPGDDHQFRSATNRPAVLANMVAFFRAHL